jgi:GntR family transcriptional regulator
MNIDQELNKRLRNIRLDTHNPIPLYYQVYSFFNQLILEGIIKAGTSFPPETDLAEALNVGRQTIRQAMAQLVREGKIERFSGKGTFVTFQNPRNQFFLDRSFSQQMADLGMNTYAKVLELSTGRIDESCSKYLQSKLGAPCLKLTRLRFGNDEPISLQYALIITEKCPDLHEYDFSTQSLFHLLTSVYKLEISEIFHSVNAILAADQQAQLLKIKAGEPLLIEDAVTYLTDGSPIETTTSYFRADRYAYSMRFQYKSNISIWQSLKENIDTVKRS